MVTAAGAGTYAATLIGQNGKVKNQATFTAPKKLGITSIQIMGAAGSYITLSRDEHPGDDLVLMQQADTLADQFKKIDIYDIFDKKGIVVNANEGVSMTVTVTGNATINVFIECDDGVATVNGKAVRALGSNAAVASVGVETGALVYANFAPGDQYRGRAIYFTSTTIINCGLGLNDQGLISVPGQNAILTGQPYTKLTDRQAAHMTGKGSEWSNTFEAWIFATAADAANVQIIGLIMEKS